MYDLSQDFHIFTVNSGPLTTLQIGGVLDLATAPSLREYLVSVIDAGTGDVVIDLADVDFLESSGLSVLVAAFQQLERQGRQLRVVNPSASACRVLQVSGLAAMFGVALPASEPLDV